MSKRRSLKDRYLGILRRLWPAPTLAALMLPVDACASRPVGSAASARDEAALSASDQAAPSAAPQPAPGADEQVRYDWDPRLLPTELHLAPELRSACAPVVALPPSLTLEEKDEVANALEPIATCLTLGPLSFAQLHILGPSELPGRLKAPVHAGGRADQLRSSLSLLGVPFEDLVTHDADNGPQVELGTAQDSQNRESS